MPELPEVETIRRDLEAALKNRTIQKISVKDPSALTGIGPGGKPFRRVTPKQFEKNVLGKTISNFDRRGKYLVMEFSDPTSLIFHLRMTGQLLLSEPAYKERVSFFFDGGSALYFSDRRRFGEVHFSQNWKEDPAILSLGAEPTDGRLTPEYLSKAFHRRTAPVHSILLNQKIVSGLGNIYATEALYESKIRPDRPCGKITPDKLAKLSRAIHKVISESIRHRGYSMNTYVDAMGKKGRSQMFSKAYGKEGLPCGSCKFTFKRIVLGGRGVVFCPKCQS